MLEQTDNRIIHRNTLHPEPYIPPLLTSLRHPLIKLWRIITRLLPDIRKINNNKFGQEIGGMPVANEAELKFQEWLEELSLEGIKMLSKLAGFALLLASLAWSSALCPKDIQDNVKSAIKTELITEGKALKGFRLFIKKQVKGSRIVIPPAQIHSTQFTTWDNYVELLYVLPEGALPRDRFQVKVLAGGRTYICTVSIYYSFYNGLAIEVE